MKTTRVYPITTKRALCREVVAHAITTGINTRQFMHKHPEAHVAPARRLNKFVRVVMKSNGPAFLGRKRYFITERAR